MDSASLRAIENGAHAAPFEVLGVQRGADGRLLRVNAPGAWRVDAPCVARRSLPRHPRVAPGARYCFAVRGRGAGDAGEDRELIVDPMAQAWETAPRGHRRAYLRTGEAAAPLLFAMNASAETRSLEVKAPSGGFWRELINTDSRHYGGADRGNCGGAHATPQSPDEGTFRLQIILPPCGTIIFRNEC